MVDARTHAIYGHVVGSNPIGEVYVSPYSAIIDQIRTKFQTSTVTIPDPITTLSSLIQCYATSIPGSIRDQVDSRSLAELEDFCSNTIRTPDRVERLLSLFNFLVELPLDSHQLQSVNLMADTPHDTSATETQNPTQVRETPSNKEDMSGQELFVELQSTNTHKQHDKTQNSELSLESTRLPPGLSRSPTPPLSSIGLDDTLSTESSHSMLSTTEHKVSAPSVLSSQSLVVQSPAYDRSHDLSRDHRDSECSLGQLDWRGRQLDKATTSREDYDRVRNRLSKAKHIMQYTPSHLYSGLGVGVLGAIVGGLAAREAQEAASRTRKDNHSRHTSDTSAGVQLLNSIVGAAIGGLGANALEKKIEQNKNSATDEQGGLPILQDLQLPSDDSWKAGGSRPSRAGRHLTQRRRSSSTPEVPDDDSTSSHASLEDSSGSDYSDPDDFQTTARPNGSRHKGTRRTGTGEAHRSLSLGRRRRRTAGKLFTYGVDRSEGDGSVTGRDPPVPIQAEMSDL